MKSPDQQHPPVQKPGQRVMKIGAEPRQVPELEVWADFLGLTKPDNRFGFAAHIERVQREMMQVGLGGGEFMRGFRDANAPVARPGERFGEAYNFFAPKPSPTGPMRLREIKAKLEAEPRSSEFGLRRLGSGHYSTVYELSSRFVLKVVRSTDPGYAKFADLCMKHKNKHLPRILYRGQWGGRDVYVIERLLDRPASGRARQLIEAVHADDNPYVTVTCPHVKELKALLEGKTNDLRPGNVMLRGDTPVVTDPYHEGFGR